MTTGMSGRYICSEKHIAPSGSRPIEQSLYLSMAHVKKSCNRNRVFSAKLGFSEYFALSFNMSLVNMRNAIGNTQSTH